MPPFFLGGGGRGVLQVLLEETKGLLEGREIRKTEDGFLLFLVESQSALILQIFFMGVGGSMLPSKLSLMAETTLCQEERAGDVAVTGTPRAAEGVETQEPESSPWGLVMFDGLRILVGIPPLHQVARECISARI